jgi:hypothetical protein
MMILMTIDDDNIMAIIRTIERDYNVPAPSMMMMMMMMIRR